MKFPLNQTMRGKSMAARNVKGLKFTAQEVQANWAKSLTGQGFKAGERTKEAGHKTAKKVD
jgi:hypothetical protein